MTQIGAGFAMMGAGIALLTTARTKLLVLLFVALLSLGMALILPNLATLVSKHGGERQAGMSLGLQNASNSLGQAAGPVVGGALFIWQIDAPYFLTGALLVAVAFIVGWKALDRRREAGLA